MFLFAAIMRDNSIGSDCKLQCIPVLLLSSAGPLSPPSLLRRPPHSRSLMQQPLRDVVSAASLSGSTSTSRLRARPTQARY